VLVTRAGCTLCDEAEPVVRRLAERAGVPVRLVDVDAAVDAAVDGDPAMGQWSDHVPVVLLDGVEHSRWWVDAEALAKALGRGV
jgi:glutaredoxin